MNLTCNLILINFHVQSTDDCGNLHVRLNTIPAILMYLSQIFLLCSRKASFKRRRVAIKLVLDGDAMWSFMLMSLFSMAMDLDLDGMYAPSAAPAFRHSVRLPFLRSTCLSHI